MTSYIYRFRRVLTLHSVLVRTEQQ